MKRTKGSLTDCAVRVDVRGQEGREEFILLIGSAFCTPFTLKCCAIFIKLFRKTLSIIEVPPLISSTALPLNCAQQIYVSTLLRSTNEEFL